MNKKPIEQAKNPDLANSFNAIRRASKRARQVAAQTGTALIVRHGEQIDRVTVTDQDILPKQTNG
jgi:DNA-directed RNA polymerase subunit K/omega